MANTIFYVLLGIFLLLFGLFSVTTIGVTWGKEIMGFAALAAGVASAYKAFKG